MFENEFISRNVWVPFGDKMGLIRIEIGEKNRVILFAKELKRKRDKKNEAALEYLAALHEELKNEGTSYDVFEADDGNGGKVIDKISLPLGILLGRLVKERPK